MKEPPRPPSPEPTFATFTRDLDKIAEQNDWREIKIRLVGAHPLWGNYLHVFFITLLEGHD